MVSNTDPSRILIIYTGGTIGSIEDHQTKSLKPVDFKQLRDNIPELNRINVNLEVIAFEQPKDSSDMNPDDWVKIVQIIEKNYSLFDGFVILHGTDTMAYTASAVSFMIENLNKPVIFTGSQLPIGKIRTDGKENIITAIEIAATKKNNKPIVPEVCIYFEFKLYRANRTFKYSAEHFNAYLSPNYPYLAEAGVNIEFNESVIIKPINEEVKFHYSLNNQIAILPLFPGMVQHMAENVIGNNHFRAVIIETYGSGNGPIENWFYRLIENAIKNEQIIFNISQCKQGEVIQGRYETSRMFNELGVIGGKDIIREAAVTKMMYLLGKYNDNDKIINTLPFPIRGELTINELKN